MTKEGLRLALVGAVSIILGLVAGWDGPLVLGAALLTATALALLFVARTGSACVLHVPNTIECERLSETTLEVVVSGKQRLGNYAEVASDPEPRRLYRLQPGANSASLRLPLDTRRRFVGSIGPIRIIRRDPLGLARRVIASTPIIDVVVTPRTTASKSRRTPPNSTDPNCETTVRSHSTNVTEVLREYVVGDEPRRIHWRSSARLGQLMVRRETNTTSTDVLIVLDRAIPTWNTAPSFADDNSADNFEVAVETLAALLSELIPTGRTVSLLCDERGTVAVDRTSERAFLRTLAAVQVSPTSTLNGRDFLLATRNLHGTTLFVVTRGVNNRRLVEATASSAIVIEPELQESTS